MVLEVWTCKYYYCDSYNSYLSEFIKWCKTIEWSKISEEIASFNSMIGMQAVCTAIIIFLYSKYNEGAQGIRNEYLIEYKMGKKTVSIYRITSLLLPCISLFFDRIHWYGVAVVSAIFMYYIICVYVQWNTSKWYYKIIRKKKVQLQDKNQVYQELKSDTINWTFSEKRQYELSLTVQDIFEEISELKTKNVIINYIYMYDLTIAILNVKLEVTESWKVALIDKIFIRLDQENNIHENSYYEVLYYAVICAILQYGKKDEKDYLWFGFFETQRKRNPKMAKKLFAFSLGFLELLRRSNIPDKYFLKNIVEPYQVEFKETCYYVKEGFNDYIDNEFCDKYSIVLSIIGCGNEVFIKKCYKDVQMDLKNIGNKNYYVKTMISFI